MANHPNRARKTVATASIAVDHDVAYAGFLAALHATFNRVGNRPLFETSVDLNPLYLRALPRSERAVHDCHACRHFLQRFGGLVTISEDGHATSALWDPDAVPATYHKAVAAMALAVEGSAITGPFLSSDPIWGTPKTGQWTHLSVRPHNTYREVALTPGQAMAAKREDFKTVSRALSEFTPAVIDEAIRLLEAGHLARSEKFVTPLQWLAGLHVSRAKGRRKAQRDNMLWLAVATAPDGFCHPRAAVTGTLLDDLAAGMAFDDVQKRFNAKVGGLVYQRPQAAPAAGNIAAAEKLFENLDLKRSLERRFARLDETQVAWAPFVSRVRPAPHGGIFSHLAPKHDATRPVRASGTPPAVLTWEKFARTVLPGAEKIEAYIHSSLRMNFIAMTTAVHEDAPPVLKWDREDARNPVAWYLYHGGSLSSQWGLLSGWALVNAIVPLPPMWGEEPQPHLGEGFVLVLDGCRDSQTMQGNALFPECLRGDLHGVRSTIEAYSRNAGLKGYAQASACGLDVRAGNKALGYRLRVTTGGLQTEYTLDRWD